MKGAVAGGKSPQRLGMGTRLRNDVLKTTTFSEAKWLRRIALLVNLHLFPPRHPPCAMVDSPSTTTRPPSSPAAHRRCRLKLLPPSSRVSNISGIGGLSPTETRGRAGSTFSSFPPICTPRWLRGTNLQTPSAHSMRSEIPLPVLFCIRHVCDISRCFRKCQAFRGVIYYTCRGVGCKTFPPIP